MYSNGKRLYHPRSIVTDHYLLDQWILDKPGPANDSSFKLQAASNKQQATSNKRLTAGSG